MICGTLKEQIWYAPLHKQQSFETLKLWGWDLLPQNWEAEKSSFFNMYEALHAEFLMGRLRTQD